MSCSETMSGSSLLLRALLASVVLLVLSCSRDSGPVIPDPPFQSPPRIDPLEAAKQPKLVVLILIDTLRADHLGCYGSKQGLTPNMDNLAVCSHVFEQAVAPSSWTRPSVASLFTSCYPSAIGIHEPLDFLSEDLLTLAEVLKVRGGYRTIAISTNGNAGKAAGFAQGFDHFIVPETKRGYPGDFELVPAEVVTQVALEGLLGWIMEGGGQSIFLFLHYVDPHDPYLPHPEMMEKPEPKGRFNGSRADLRTLDGLAGNRIEKEDRDRIEHLYAGEVRYCDHWLGMLLRGISRIHRKWANRMMVIVTADHGEGLWDHGVRHHGHILYEEQVHVPLLIKLPGMGIEDGTRISEPVSLIDIAPTVLEVCGIPHPPQFQGHGLTPLMHGEQRDPALEPVYAELRYRHLDYESLLWGRRKTIRNRAKARHDPESFKLFDLALDPSEQDDLALSEASVDWAAATKKALEKWGEAVKGGDKYASRIKWEDLDKETLENLRALGYAAGQ